LTADKNIQQGNEFYDNEEEGDRNAALHREATPPKRARSKSPRPQSNFVVTFVIGLHMIPFYLVAHTPRRSPLPPEPSPITPLGEGHTIKQQG